MSDVSPSSSSMTRTELKASVSLALIFALRMLGLFLILPVFALYAKTLSGGESATLVGLAMGMYGLTQSIGQIPLGMASDKYGRKPVILVGLLLFAVGSIVAACSSHIGWVIVGRAIQGAGAISAAITAFIADATRPECRTRAMAMVGVSIGLTFIFSLVVSPMLYQTIGMSGIFIVTGVLSVLGMIWVRYGIPDVPQVVAKRVSLRMVLRHPELLRLNYGVFCLHAMQMAMFLVIPQALVDTLDLPIAEHWKIYLGVMFVSFILMIPLIIASEKKGKTKHVFIGMIMLLLASQWGFAQYLGNGFGLVLLLSLFFVAFNTMEASLPSLVSRLAPKDAKGAALGVYNTLQSLGLFFGGFLGGYLKSQWGVSSIFILGVVFSAVWLIIAFGMQNLSSRDMT